MMNKHLIVSGIAVLLICVGLSGCEQVSNIGRDSRFVGKWTNIYTIEFFSDGTCAYIGGISATWDIKDGKLVINFSEGIVSYNFVFSDNNNKLTLEGGGGFLAGNGDYTKQ